jgi:hypothetical protein
MVIRRYRLRAPKKVPGNRQFVADEVTGCRTWTRVKRSAEEESGSAAESLPRVSLHVLCEREDRPLIRIFLFNFISVPCADVGSWVTIQQTLLA